MNSLHCVGRRVTLGPFCHVDPQPPVCAQFFPFFSHLVANRLPVFTTGVELSINILPAIQHHKSKKFTTSDHGAVLMRRELIDRRRSIL